VAESRANLWDIQLSESTERLDRREKRLAYPTMASLQEYVLVAQDARRVEAYRRTDDCAPSIHTEGPVR
jgi:Uma2 family endonuclease